MEDLQLGGEDDIIVFFEAVCDIFSERVQNINLSTNSIYKFLIADLHSVRARRHFSVSLFPCPA
jgi:hypothetical protein